MQSTPASPHRSPEPSHPLPAIPRRLKVRQLVAVFERADMGDPLRQVMVDDDVDAPAGQQMAEIHVLADIGETQEQVLHPSRSADTSIRAGASGMSSLGRSAAWKN